MKSVSPWDGPLQDCFETPATPRDGPRVVVPREILQFDAAGAFDAAGWGDDDYTPPEPPSPASPGGVAVAPLPCRRGTHADGRLVYSLNVVLIRNDPDDADDPEYIAEGQTMLEFAYLQDAQEAADDYAAEPERLPLIQVPGVTHIVVNDWRGVERYRQRIQPGGPRKAA